MCFYIAIEGSNPDVASYELKNLLKSMLWLLYVRTPMKKLIHLFVLAFLLPCAVCAQTILINEVDAVQDGTDAAEFVELYYPGGSTDLTGLVLVFFNGSDILSYEAFDLDGMSTNASGYFVLCGDAANVANCDLDVTKDTNLIQNGAEAVALIIGDAVNYPNDTAIPPGGVVDAIVYDVDDPDEPGLLVLLAAGQPQVNEDGEGNGTGHSNQRFPNRSGLPLYTDTYVQAPPTPGTENMAIGVANENDIVIPVAIQLNQNYPNPFNPTTEISYSLSLLVTYASL